MKNLNHLIVLTRMIHKISYYKVRVTTGGVETEFCLFVVVVVSLSIQLNTRASTPTQKKTGTLMPGCLVHHP